MKAVVLAGGQGTRLAPYTKVLPKPLMPIGDMPILEVLLHQMKACGVDEVIMTVGHLAELLRAFFQDGERFGLDIRYSIEDRPLGTAGPLSLLQEELEDTFVVTNGDVLTTMSFEALVDAHRRSGGIATIATHKRKVHVDLGVIQCDGGQQVTGYIEKPTINLQVSMGIYVFEPRVLSYIYFNQHLDFPDLVRRLLKNEERVTSYPFGGYWQDLGRPDDYEQAAKDFDAMKSQFLESNGA